MTIIDQLVSFALCVLCKTVIAFLKSLALCSAFSTLCAEQEHTLQKGTKDKCPVARDLLQPVRPALGCNDPNVRQRKLGRNVMGAPTPLAVEQLGRRRRMKRNASGPLFRRPVV